MWLFTDFLEIFAAVIFIFLAMLVIFSSLYDRHLRSLSYDCSDHVHSTLKSKSKNILVIFSIKRNWYILSLPVKSNVRDLRFLEAFRMLITFGVIHNHCAMYSIMIPSSNPIFIDEV